ncbi:GNAT family N-acetyltransferase [Haliangium sp.]|uniref:GNAT family N-acetyltransferase n=1 Tax=Haliangium sp. TaxID=2663208 RepID=UPI003D10B16C
MDSAVTTRTERPEDHDAIWHVNQLAFGQPNEADLVDALRAAGALTLSLVAERDHEVVGHIAFSPVTVASPAGDFEAIGLAPLAVVPEQQRRGVGTQLVRAGLDLLGRAGHQVVIVLGHPDYYPRFGFVRASSRGIRWEHEADDDAFMALELEPGALAGRVGVVRFHPAFTGV